jgi:flagellar L-ring protein precursor FlgH
MMLSPFDTRFDLPPASPVPGERAGATRRAAAIALPVAIAALALILPTLAYAREKQANAYAAAMPQPAAPKAVDGAIFNVAAGYAGLVEGRRARMVGDPLTIVLVENMTTSKTQAGKTQKNGSFSVVPPTAGPLSFLNPNALKASGASSFNGQGNASQTSSLSGEVSVTIAEVRTNGTALVKGEKRLLLSQGDEWVQFSGIVRLGDIDGDNRIPSNRVADAHVEYAGKGSIARSAKEGWLSKFFNMISPF